MTACRRSIALAVRAVYGGDGNDAVHHGVDPVDGLTRCWFPSRHSRRRAAQGAAALLLPPGGGREPASRPHRSLCLDATARPHAVRPVAPLSLIVKAAADLCLRCLVARLPRCFARRLGPCERLLRAAGCNIRHVEGRCSVMQRPSDGAPFMDAPSGAVGAHTRPGSRSVISCNCHWLPSGSAKDARLKYERFSGSRPPTGPWSGSRCQTALTSTPRSIRSSRATSMSSTTGIKPWSGSVLVVRPLPN